MVVDGCAGEASWAAAASEIVLWRKGWEVYSGGIFAAGLLSFALTTFWGFSLITLLCYVAMLHLLARFVYRNGTAVLAEANVIKAHPPAVAPAAFVTEEEVARHLATITSLANSAFATAFSLAVCDDNVLVLKSVGFLFAVARIGDLLGTTLLAFLVFVGVFTLPKGYELKQPEVDAFVSLVLASARGAYGQLAAKAKDLKNTSKNDASKKKL